jgi:hypothetical protein
MSQIYQEFEELVSVSERRDYPKSQHLENIVKFWDWERNNEIPHNRLSSYLFAAVACRVGMGAKKIIDRGLVNDIRTISTYAPYVEAMFIDKSCAALLAEEPLVSELEYKARIFSLNDTDEFISYLKEIEAGAPIEVRDFAREIYGVG